MSEACNCPVCGEWDDGHDSHHCPGSPSERLDDLESRVSTLEDEYLSKTHLVEILRRLAKIPNRFALVSKNALASDIYKRIADEIEKE